MRPRCWCAGGQTWVQAAVAGTPPLPDAEVPLSGGDLAPGVRALGLVGLAGVAALPATRSLGRSVVGVLLALTGAGVLAQVVDVLSDAEGAARGSTTFREVARGGAQTTVDVTGAPLACLLGGLLLLLAGLLVAVRGRRWAALGARYDAPTSPRPEPEPAQTRPGAATWDALDRGEDPTR